MSPTTGGPGGASVTKPALPIWSIPLLLAIVGIALAVGNLSLGAVILVACASVLSCAYLLWRGRKHPSVERPTSNVIALLPGHVLLLLAVALLPASRWLPWLWVVLPIASIAYDLAAIRVPRGRARTSILIGAYAILWAALFTLLNRVIAIGRGFGEREEIIAAVVFGVFGGLFLAIGIFRHARADKE